MTVLLILTLLLAAPTFASAQEAVARAAHIDPARARDHIAHISDTMQLRALEQEFVRSEGQGATVAAGLAALRLWELTGDRTHARRSRTHFDRAADRDSKNAWAHYGHALSLEAEMNREPGRVVTHINAARDLGLDPLSRARRALERAVVLDPTLPGALELLARYSIETGDEDALMLARSSFEMAVAASGGISGLLGIAMTARELGDHAAAAAAARRAVAESPESANAHLELAISLANMTDSLAAAGAAYGAALGLADASMLERMWQDTRMLHTERDTEQWNEADTSERRRLLRGFWGMRGATAGLTGDERAAEHYRRMTVARRRYPRHGMFGAAAENALRLENVSSTFDDRGVIYIRHGQPEHTLGTPPLEDYIAWFYTDEAGDPLSYHFYRDPTKGQSKDYVLMYDLPCPIDPIAAVFDPRLTPLLNPRRCDFFNIRSISAVIDRDAEHALRTDSHRPAFVAAMPFHFDWYTFRADGGTEVLMAVGVPLDVVPPGAQSLSLGLSVIDTAVATVARTSRITGPLTHGDSPGSILRTQVSMVTSPASGIYRIDVRDASNPLIGTIYGGDIHVPDYSGDTLMVSDVMLAEQNDSASLARGDARLALAPTQVFQNGEFRVYYEVYNLPAGTGYSTTLRVEPQRRGGLIGGIRRLFGGDDDAVELRFEDTAAPDASGTLRELRDITAPFRPGAWLLRLTITTESGSVTRERRFTIEEG